jgi:hypothetical protein
LSKYKYKNILSKEEIWSKHVPYDDYEEHGMGINNAAYLPLDIKEGTLIAYLIREDDKNIEHPIGRVLLKPYYNGSQCIIIAVKPCEKIYGTVPKSFVEIVQKWADEKFNKGKTGLFRRSKLVYPEGEPTIRK